MRSLAALAALAAVCCASDVVRTPFGVVHKDCVLHLASGSTIADRGVDGVTITHANGTRETLPPCAAEPRAVRPTAAAAAPQQQQQQRVRDSDQPEWNGWYEHFWYSADVSFFTTPALVGNVTSMSAVWVVPETPANMNGNANSPWPSVPTQSWWIGLQSRAAGAPVLQPVIELNGLVPGEFDASSWNCCPQGYVAHSSPIPAQSGAVVKVCVPCVWCVRGEGAVAVRGGVCFGGERSHADA